MQVLWRFCGKRESLVECFLMGLTRKMGSMDSKKTHHKIEQPKQAAETTKLRGTDAIPRKRKRVALSSALAVFLTFTLAFSSFAWGAANDVSGTVFANDAISDIPAENAQYSVVPSGENKANETAETDAVSQETLTKGSDDSAASADGEAFIEESSNTGADGDIGAAAENEGIEPLAAMVEAEDISTCMTVQNIPYIDANGVQQTCPEATVVAADKNEWTSGWYSRKHGRCHGAFRGQGRCAPHPGCGLYAQRHQGNHRVGGKFPHHLCAINREGRDGNS